MKTIQLITADHNRVTERFSAHTDQADITADRGVECGSLIHCGLNEG